MTDAYYAAVERLPGRWGAWLSAVPSHTAQQITGVRLRSGCPVGVTCGGSNLFLADSGRLVQRGTMLPALSHKELQECFVSLCRYSVFSYEDQLRRGFFTLPGGHRVGVAAQAAWREDTLLQPKNITSLAMRIARPMPLQQRDVWMQLLAQYMAAVLIVGPPGSGKTTVLRGLAGLLSDMGRRVAVIDERCELFPVDADGFCLQQPWNCDVISGLPKGVAVQQALRALAPQVILCDELAPEDMPALQTGLNSGVGFVATVHAVTQTQLRQKMQFQTLQQIRAVTTLVFLQGEDRPGLIREKRYVDT